VERQVDPMDLIRSFISLGEAELTWNACEALWLAGMPVTTTNLLRFASSLPYPASELLDPGWQRKSFCNQCLKTAYERDPQGEADEVRRVIDYFFGCFIHLRVMEQVLELDAFVAFIGDIESEAETKTGEYRLQFQPTDDICDGTEEVYENEEKVANNPTT
jgi:hypothetical protein